MKNPELSIREQWYTKIVVSLIKFILKYLLFPLVRIIWIKDIKGLDNIPNNGGAIVAFNHQSYFDFIGFMAISPRPVYYLAAEKFYTKETNPLWGPIMQATGQIKVNRNSKDKDGVYEAVYRLLKQGELIGIFPEGTRAPDNQKMLHAFPGVARFSITAQVPIIPVGIKGAYQIMSRHDSKPRFIKKLEFIIGESIKPITEIGNTTKDEYQAVADNLMREISKLSGKKYLYE